MSRVLRFDSKGEPFLGDPPTNGFHPKYDLINLYEIVGEAGEVEWAGGSAHEAIKLLRSSAGKRLLVSGWESNDEDARLIGQPLDVTQVALAAIVWER